MTPTEVAMGSVTQDEEYAAYVAASRQERHEVVLADVADGTETVIEPPKANGQLWDPLAVTWSPDGTTVLYAAWGSGDTASASGLVVVPADSPGDASMLIDGIGPAPNVYSHRWAPVQVWGRQPR